MRYGHSLYTATVYGWGHVNRQNKVLGMGGSQFLIAILRLFYIIRGFLGSISRATLLELDSTFILNLE